jgi:hypothetical protein
VSRTLEPLKTQDLPERTLPFWKMTGPGAILVGLSIGAGELILWPWITARFGAGMAWAAALGVFIQLWLNFEVGRWAISTGESAFTGYARLWRGFVPFFLVINFIIMILPGWARASGNALRALIFGPEGPGPDWVWTAVTFAGIALILFGPKTFYAAIERSISALVVIITLGMMYVFYRTVDSETLAEFGRGLINVGRLETADDFTGMNLFSAVVFAGAGGISNLFYAYYLRDKRIGMGARVPRLINPLRGTEEADIATGFIFEDSPENTRRFRDWFRFVKLDQTLYFWLLNSFTMFLFMFGSLAVLHKNGVVPERSNIVYELATILKDIMGTPGLYIYLIVGMAALFSTQLTFVDGGSRVFADLLHTNVARFRAVPQSRLYVWFAVGGMIVGVISTFLFENMLSGFDVILYNALANGLAMAVYVPCTLIVNLRYLPKSARPGPLNIAMVSVAAAVYVSFAVYTAYTLVTSLFG